MRAAGIPESPSYVFDHDAPPVWTGPVVRLADLSDEERIRLGGRARDDYPPSVHHTWRCGQCREWTMPHAFEPDRCNFCGTTRAAA